MSPTVLSYRHYRYFIAAVVLAVGSLVAYIAIVPAIGVRSGASWVGYTLGTIGALLIVWLTWFGVRKRAYSATGPKLQAWLSAHIWLGLALIVVATLHTGFLFGWNIHTLAYVLMMLVILSGAFGVVTYLRYPSEITRGRSNLTVDVILARLSALDRELMAIAREISGAPLLAAVGEEPVVGRTAWQQITGRVHDDRVAPAIAQVEAMPTGGSEDTALAANRALSLLRRKSGLLTRVRREYQWRALMRVWLYVHVPLATGLLAALTAHIIAVFYW